MIERIPTEDGWRCETEVEVYCRAEGHRSRRVVVRLLRAVWAERVDGHRLTPVRVVDTEETTLADDRVVASEERDQAAAAIAAGMLDVSTLPELRGRTELECDLCRRSHVEGRARVSVRTGPGSGLDAAIERVVHNATRRGGPARVSLETLAAMV